METKQNYAAVVKFKWPAMTVASEPPFNESMDAVIT